MFHGASEVLNCSKFKSEPLELCFTSASKFESEPLEFCFTSATISATDLTSTSTSCSELVPPMSFSSPSTQCTFTHLQSPNSPSIVLSNDTPLVWDNRHYDDLLHHFQLSDLSAVSNGVMHPLSYSAEKNLASLETRSMQSSFNDLTHSPTFSNTPYSQTTPLHVPRRSTQSPSVAIRATATDCLADDLRLDDAVIDSIISQHFECNGCSIDDANDDDFLCVSELSFPSSQNESVTEHCDHFSNADSTFYEPLSNDFIREPITDTPLTSLDHTGSLNHHIPPWDDQISTVSPDALNRRSQCLSEQMEGWSENSGRQKVQRGRISRVKKKAKITRARAKPWTAEEHRRFEESLELYGRNWEQCAKYIGTRRASLVRSHAQKHLIKLWKLGKPLPKKLAETGSGYTLSGKPLLADSASARSYLIKLPCPEASDISQ